MSRKGKHYEPTNLERVLFGILGGLSSFTGTYAVSPWYVHVAPLGSPTAYTLFASDAAVRVYGTIVLITGLCMLYAAFARATAKLYFPILTNALLVNFLVRFYVQIGLFLLAQSWRPPSWASPLSLVVITATLYVWVRLRERFA